MVEPQNFSESAVVWLCGYDIDIIDYVTGIGNLSRDQYIRTRTPCYSLHHFVLSNSIATRPKTATAAHLSSDSSKTKTISRFFRAYSSEGVSTLHVNSEDGVPKPLS